MTFQAWKMVFLNSMTFYDQGAPCILHASLSKWGRWHHRIRWLPCNYLVPYQVNKWCRPLTERHQEQEPGEVMTSSQAVDFIAVDQALCILHLGL